MKINLYEKNINKIDAFLELKIIQKSEKLSTKLIETLEKINFFKDSYNIHLDYESKILYISCLEFKSENIKIAIFKTINFLKNKKIETIKLDINQNGMELKIKDIVEGLILGSYSFDRYKNSKNILNINEIKISIKSSSKSKEKLQEQLNKTLLLTQGVNYTRDIVNTPPFEFVPKSFSQKALEFTKNKNIKCKVFGEEYLLKNGMNAMFSVGKASVNESQLVHLSYKAKEAKAKIVIVGKGVTYDTGGLSLKRGEGMVSMKCDKAGASAILGIFDVLSKYDLPLEVHGIIGAVENMIGGDAYKPDDVLIAKNGKSIEVTNTDAEGRLVLADCLCYAQDEIKDIDFIFDLATLTGSSIMAFGGYTHAIMGYNDKLKSKIQKASMKSGELVGFLPFNQFLEKRLKSEVADMINTSSNKNGGAITAALFLSKFIKEENKNKWLHFDLAGPSYRQEEWDCNPYGATGAGVRLLFRFMEKVSKSLS